MGYPKKETEQVSWWLQQLSYSRQRMKPLFEASSVLARQYYNEAATWREKSLEGDSLTGEAVTARTRSSIVFGWIDQSLANMIDRHPVFRCLPDTEEAAAKLNPADPGSLSMADAVTRVVNYRYRETNQLRVDERVAQDAFLYPYGVAKIGYTVDVDKRAQELLLGEGADGALVLDDPEEENLFLVMGEELLVTEDQDHKAHIAAHLRLLRESTSAGWGGAAPEQAAQAESGIERHIELHKNYDRRAAPSANTNVRNEAPFAVWWPADMFLTDALCLEGPQDARWVAFQWELPVEEVQADPNYDHSVTRRLEPSRWQDAPDKPENLLSDGLDIVRGWEIWAKNFPVGPGRFEDLLVVVAEGSDRFLRNEQEWPYSYLDDYPVETLVFNPGPRSWFHKSPLIMGGADTVQSLVNEILDSYLSLVRRQKNVWLVDPASGLSTEILEDILDAPDGSAVEVPGLAEMQGRPIMALPFAEAPPEKGTLLRVLQSMFDRALGTPQPVALPQSDSATEASIMEKRNTSRENRRAGLLAEFQVRKARKMWQLDAQFRPERTFAADRAGEVFFRLTEELARGEYLFTVDISSKAVDQGMERSQWLDLLNLFSGLTPLMIQAFGGPPNLPELARRLLARGFGDKNAEDILPMLRQQPEPEAEEAAPTEAPSEASGGILPGAGNGTTYENPEARSAQNAVMAGRTQGKAVGPLDRALFNRNIPNPGRKAGAGERAK